MSFWCLTVARVKFVLVAVFINCMRINIRVSELNLSMRRSYLKCRSRYIIFLIFLFNFANVICKVQASKNVFSTSKQRKHEKVKRSRKLKRQKTPNF